MANLRPRGATARGPGRIRRVTTRQPFAPPTVLSGAALPLALRDLTSPPEAAYLWGHLPPGPRIGLVGTRKPSREGFRIAFETARRLSALGMTIVSGGAWGIDRAAHLGALRSRGKTLVVAPLWLDAAYPRENRTLFGAVLARGGAYLTVGELGAIPFGPTFARRNEVLVALCDVVLFGEMGVPSGALTAARFARAQGRPRLLLPWSLDAPDTCGVEAELDRAAGGYFRPSQLVRLLEGRRFDNPEYWERSAEVLLEWAAGEARRRKRRRRTGKAQASSPVQDRPPAPVQQSASKSGALSVHPDPVLAAIIGGTSTIDGLVERTGFNAAVVQHRVLCLTLEGAVCRDAAGLLRGR
jgi:DNA processing protein